MFIGCKNKINRDLFNIFRMNDANCDGVVAKDPKSRDSGYKAEHDLDGDGLITALETRHALHIRHGLKLERIKHPLTEKDKDTLRLLARKKIKGGKVFAGKALLASLGFYDEAIKNKPSVETLSAIAIYMGSDGQFDQMFKYASSQKSFERQKPFLKNIYEKMDRDDTKLNKNKRRQALRRCFEIAKKAGPDDINVSVTMTDIIIRMQQAGFYNDALKSIKSLKLEGHKLFVINKILVPISQDTFYKREVDKLAKGAFKIVISYPDRRSVTRDIKAQDTAQTLAKLGKYKPALKLAQKILRDQTRKFTFEALGRIVSSNTDIVKFTALFSSIKYSYEKDAFLSAALTMLLEAGQQKESIKMAESISDHYHRANVLRKIAFQMGIKGSSKAEIKPIYIKALVSVSKMDKRNTTWIESIIESTYKNIQAAGFTLQESRAIFRTAGVPHP
ncbi:MAG: hypothetical protein HQ564_00980 [Candidatus Saganbacteria bacterium]|nr:hypothetical protein [Candidatus Saganbacteria bacterium]